MEFRWKREGNRKTEKERERKENRERERERERSEKLFTALFDYRFSLSKIQLPYFIYRQLPNNYEI